MSEISEMKSERSGRRARLWNLTALREKPSQSLSHRNELRGRSNEKEEADLHCCGT